MLTINKIGQQIITPISQIYCLSQDTKPMNVLNGSIAYEIDTSIFYVFDGENLEWIQLTSRGSDTKIAIVGNAV